MYRDLLKFEWLFVRRKKTFYGMLLFYLAIGIFAGTEANFSFPNTYYNGTTVLVYIIGIASLLCIFSTSILAAQTLFREKDANFGSILYSTPLRKTPYVLSRFSIVFFISALCYFLFVCGLAGGQLLEAEGNVNFGPFRIWNYFQPLLLLLLPNILFCTAVSCGIGLFSKNKMLVYVSGVFIYFLYWGVSLFTNSPLMVNSAPMSESAMSLAAVLDPFGMAAYFEQTRNWTAVQNNNQLLQLKDNLLVNRFLYLTFSVGILFFAYREFCFATHQKTGRRKKSVTQEPQSSFYYNTASTITSTLGYDLKSLWSLLKLESLNILKNIPIWIVIIGWIGFLAVEVYSSLDGNTRIPERFATTGKLFEIILSGLPLVALMVLLFFGNGIFWRSRDFRFAELENTTAVKSSVLLVAKWLSLIFIILLLLIASILMGGIIQYLYAWPIIDWELYASLFYLIGLPLVLSAGLIMTVQALVRNRYLGIAIAGIILAVSNTFLGNMLGFKHPLLRFANAFQGHYSEINGFGQNLIAFDYTMIYWLCVSIFLFLLVEKIRNRKKHFRTKLLSRTNAVLCMFFVGAAISGIYIFWEVKIIDKETKLDWKQAYENTYSFLEDKPQPIVTDVNTKIKLYPDKASYKVNGVYTMVNKSDSPIDTIYMYGDKEMKWRKWNLGKGQLVNIDAEYGYYIFKTNHSLQPGDSIYLEFDFEYQGSAFNAPDSYNTIIKNGSFIRISNYFPRAGYVFDNEIDDRDERKKRSMPKLNNLLWLNAPKNEYAFINFDAVISTKKGQTSISVGEMKKQWNSDRRSHFRYKSNSPIPFRFAVSSAKYAVKKVKNGNTSIQVYFHPEHYQNIDHILEVAKQSLEYCEANFGNYPLADLRFVEISSFTSGFAGTAYPGSLFINERFGFQNEIDGNPKKDILCEMVSHELSHTWWGNSAIAPDYREGSKLLTETLAMYTELMIYKKIYGEEGLLNRVNVHKDIYLNQRSDADEEALYKSHPDKPYLCYDKGMVVMYQLYKLLGEEKINAALRSFYNKFSYPNSRPVSTDLLNEFYAVATPANSLKINELVKEIVTYDIILEKTVVKKTQNGQFNLKLTGTINKYKEDGKGKSVLLPFSGTLEAAVYFDENSSKKVISIPKMNKIDTTILLSQKPVRVALDPHGKFLTRFDELKMKKIENAEN